MNLVLWHGRSGLSVACILCFIFNLSPYDSLEYTSKCHASRKEMRDKWRALGSPQSSLQKKFIYKIFQPINSTRIYRSSVGFSTILSYSVKIPDVGFFVTYKSAFDEYKRIYESNASNKIFLMFTHNPKDSWISIQEKIMLYIIKLQFDQHEEIRTNLLNTYLRPVVFHQENDSFWGSGREGSGSNKLGKIISSVRLKYFNESINSEIDVEEID
jgi:hypothetical protein